MTIVRIALEHELSSMKPIKVRTFIKWAITLLISLFAFQISAELFLPKRHFSSTADYCDKCGIRRWITKDAPVGVDIEGAEELVETDLSKWYAEHLGRNCDHQWRHNHSNGETYLTLGSLRLWRISGEAGSSVTPRLVDLSDDDQQRLEELLAQSPDKCREYIHEQLAKLRRNDE
jgi:hypothetical protein